MGMGQGVRPGLGHGGITYVLQTQFSSFFFFFFFFLGGGRWGVAGGHDSKTLFRSAGRLFLLGKERKDLLDCEFLS